MLQIRLRMTTSNTQMLHDDLGRDSSARAVVWSGLYTGSDPNPELLLPASLQ